MALKIKVFSTKHQSSCSLLFHQSHSRKKLPKHKTRSSNGRGGSQAPWLRATKFLINLKGGLCFIANSQHFTQEPQCLLATELKTSSIRTVFSAEFHINPTNLCHPLSAKNSANSCIYHMHKTWSSATDPEDCSFCILHPHNLATGELFMRIFSLQVMGFLPSKPDWFPSCIKKELPTATSTVVFPLLGCVLLFLWLLA